MIVFLDIETTGLSPRNDLILEVAGAAVDATLTPVAGFASVIHRPHGDTIARCDDFVKQMHTGNGLFRECDAADPQERGLVAVTDALVAWLDALTPHTPGRPAHTLAGDSVHFDRSFLQESMPRVADRFSHRLLDVSAFRVAREVLGLPGFDAGPVAHRAQADVMASIAKARWHLSRVVA